MQDSLFQNKHNRMHIDENDLFYQNERIIRQTNEFNQRLNHQLKIQSMNNNVYSDQMSGFQNVNQQLGYLKSLYSKNEDLLKEIERQSYRNGQRIGSFVGPIQPINYGHWIQPVEHVNMYYDCNSRRQYFCYDDRCQIGSEQQYQQQQQQYQQQQQQYQQQQQQYQQQQQQYEYVNSQCNQSTRYPFSSRNPSYRQSLQESNKIEMVGRTENQKRRNVIDTDRYGEEWCKNMVGDRQQIDRKWSECHQQVGSDYQQRMEYDQRNRLYQKEVEYQFKIDQMDRLMDKQNQIIQQQIAEMQLQLSNQQYKQQQQTQQQQQQQQQQTQQQSQKPKYNKQQQNIVVNKIRNTKQQKSKEKSYTQYSQSPEVSRYSKEKLQKNRNNTKEHKKQIKQFENIQQDIKQCEMANKLYEVVKQNPVNLKKVEKQFGDFDKVIKSQKNIESFIDYAIELLSSQQKRIKRPMMLNLHLFEKNIKYPKIEGYQNQNDEEDHVYIGQDDYDDLENEVNNSQSIKNMNMNKNKNYWKSNTAMTKLNDKNVYRANTMVANMNGYSGKMRQDQEYLEFQNDGYTGKGQENATPQAYKTLVSQDIVSSRSRQIMNKSQDGGLEESKLGKYFNELQNYNEQQEQEQRDEIEQIKKQQQEQLKYLKQLSKQEQHKCNIKSMNTTLNNRSIDQFNKSINMNDIQKNNTLILHSVVETQEQDNLRNQQLENKFSFNQFGNPEMMQEIYQKNGFNNQIQLDGQARKISGTNNRTQKRDDNNSVSQGSVVPEFNDSSKYLSNIKGNCNYENRTDQGDQYTGFKDTSRMNTFNKDTSRMNTQNNKDNIRLSMNHIESQKQPIYINGRLQSCSQKQSYKSAMNTPEIQSNHVIQQVHPCQEREINISQTYSHPNIEKRQSYKNQNQIINDELVIEAQSRVPCDQVQYVFQEESKVQNEVYVINQKVSDQKIKGCYISQQGRSRAPKFVNNIQKRPKHRQGPSNNIIYSQPSFDKRVSK